MLDSTMSSNQSVHNNELTVHQIFDLESDHSDPEPEQQEDNTILDEDSNITPPSATEYDLKCAEDFQKAIELSDSIFKPLAEFLTSERRIFALTWRNLMQTKSWDKYFILDHHIWLSNLFQHKCQLMKLPTRATKYAAGYDVYLPNTLRITSGAAEIVDSGVRIGAKFPKDCYIQIKQKSSLAVQGIQVFEGVIDADYKDTIKFRVENLTQRFIWTGQAGIRIAQLIVLKYNHHTSDSECDSDTDTYSHRIRTGGFGSTGQ